MDPIQPGLSNVLSHPSGTTLEIKPLTQGPLGVVNILLWTRTESPGKCMAPSVSGLSSGVSGHVSLWHWYNWIKHKERF